MFILHPENIEKVMLKEKINNESLNYSFNIMALSMCAS